MSTFSKCDRGVSVRPKKGDCVIFYSMLADGHRVRWERLRLSLTSWQNGALDEKSLHAGCDVHIGDKWSANYWVRTHSLFKQQHQSLFRHHRPCTATTLTAAG